MKRYLFTLEGFVDLPEELTLEQVETSRAKGLFKNVSLQENERK